MLTCVQGAIVEASGAPLLLHPVATPPWRRRLSPARILSGPQLTKGSPGPSVVHPARGQRRPFLSPRRRVTAAAKWPLPRFSTTPWRTLGLETSLGGVSVRILLGSGRRVVEGGVSVRGASCAPGAQRHAAPATSRGPSALRGRGARVEPSGKSLFLRPGPRKVRPGGASRQGSGSRRPHPCPPPSADGRLHVLPLSFRC